MLYNNVCSSTMRTPPRAKLLHAEEDPQVRHRLLQEVQDRHTRVLLRHRRQRPLLILPELRRRILFRHSALNLNPHPAGPNP